MLEHLRQRVLPIVLLAWLRFFNRIDPTGHLLGCLLALTCISLASLPLRLLFRDKKTRWFALHALVNFTVSIYAVPDCLTTLARPTESMTLPMHSMTPSYLAFAIHLYHILDSTCCSGSTLRLEDVMHHVVFCGVFGAVNFALEWGPIVNVLLCFITGVPGGINYVLLVLRKKSYITGLTQKHWYKWIDVSIRAPGLVGVGVAMLWNAMESRTNVPLLAAIGCALLASLNGIYYARQAFDSYAKAVADAKTIKGPVKGPIKCITFDLDDTIWRCQPVIEHAADMFYTFLHAHYPEIIQLYPTKLDWRKLSATITATNPDKQHDLTLIRKICLRQAAREAHLNPDEVVEPCYTAFINARNDIVDHLFPGALQVLQTIQHHGIQMGAISNGNAVVGDIPVLSKYFDFAVNPETAGAKKPSMAPFQQALKLSCATVPTEIIHVGDSLRSDVHPAIEFGCGRVVWLKTGSTWSGTNPLQNSQEQLNKGTGDVALNDIRELIGVLENWGVFERQDKKKKGGDKKETRRST